MDFNIFFFSSPPDNVCPEGWFGLNCEYKCNCFGCPCFVHNGGKDCNPWGPDWCHMDKHKYNDMSYPSKLTEDFLVGSLSLFKCSAEIVHLPPEMVSIERLQILRHVDRGFSGMTMEPLVDYVMKTNKTTNFVRWNN
ncbi:scavenger receptor class F member 1 [Elysia marginata]|uniref:Scavenger receptor class F member 1 n=1 Tax=Elysia marginata TaxID=1093978 RepID=A0AAV4EEK7_9GAST|nr:scavenger receptor class F member 1 [Elysia marginata]